MSLTPRAHQGHHSLQGRAGLPGRGTAAHSLYRAWHSVLSPALDPGSSDTARSPQEPPGAWPCAPAPCRHTSGVLQGCCPKSLLPNFCPTQWPGATMAQVISICVWAPAVEGDCCSATGSSGGAQTPSTHLSPRGTFPAAPPTQTPRTQAQAYRGAGLLLCAYPSTWAHLSPRLPGDDL